MSRETPSNYKVAILATGDEITHGDILNTNSQEIAHKLKMAHMDVRLHVNSPDTIAEIKASIAFLLNEHHAIIITGGLGPTSDDLTRFALSEVIQKPLQFDEGTWQNICTRLNKFGYPNPPESNRQQALFPEGAEIISNPKGSAAGCLVFHEGKPIFLLPGPPNECLPMVDSTVISTLQKKGFPRIKFRRNWFLFGVSEGKIAEELDAIVKDFPSCITGYRLFYPYIEFKIESSLEAEFNVLLPLIENVISSYYLGNGQKIFSVLLKEKVVKTDLRLWISDHATGGALEATIKTPATHQHFIFVEETEEKPSLYIHGLTEYWSGDTESSQTDIALQLEHEDYDETILKEIPFRGKRVVQYAVECICRQIYEFFNLADVD